MEDYTKLAEFLGLILSDTEDIRTFGIVIVESDYLLYKTCKITRGGIFYLTTDGVWAPVPPSTYLKLINGVYGILQDPFVPKMGETYYTYNDGGIVEETFEETQYDYENVFTGNCFETEEQALANGEKFVQNLKNYYESLLEEKELY